MFHLSLFVLLFSYISIFFREPVSYEEITTKFIQIFNTVKQEFSIPEF